MKGVVGKVCLKVFHERIISALKATCLTKVGGFFRYEMNLNGDKHDEHEL